ncbi:hypothetical protein NUW58_g4301 [Xylaria curta]|uniref:Uncharacterized protein n=1 Tax=Xylaria curta TaxID=42375 RepID=A0ACC1P8D3_9PEZI|nr:hypothetical protein NUW58_g4301 [Xylaria curta]
MSPCPPLSTTASLRSAVATKTCTSLPRSSNTTSHPKCWHTYYKQFNRRSSTERRRNDASPIVSESTASRPRFDVDQDNKTIATAVGHLPLSPVMDPSYWEATTRHQVPKAKQGKAQNSVERQFRKNPYARALATPLRWCAATHTRVPAFFLQDFNLLAHPETSQPWWVPRSLVWEEPDESHEDSAASNEFSANTQEWCDERTTSEADRTESSSLQRTPSENEPSTAQSKNTKPYGPSAYVLARRDVISAFTWTSGSRLVQYNKRLFGGSSSRYKSLAGTAVWREDMDCYILDRMRKGIVEDFIYLSRLCTEDSRYYIVRCHGWDDVQYKHKGSVLWLGDNVTPGETASPEIQPGPFATYNICDGNVTTIVAVHNIPMLLGTKDTAKVRQQAKVFANGSLFMLAGRRTTDLQAKLWRLQGYLADYTKLPRTQV